MIDPADETDEKTSYGEQYMLLLLSLITFSISNVSTMTRDPSL